MTAGELRHYVAFEAPTNTLNSAGETTVAWVHQFYAYAKVEPRRAWQVERSRAVDTNTTHDVTIRYDERVKPDWRINHNATILNITGVIDPEGRHVWNELTCEQHGATA